MPLCRTRVYWSIFRDEGGRGGCKKSRFVPQGDIDRWNTQYRVSNRRVYWSILGWEVQV